MKYSFPTIISIFFLLLFSIGAYAYFINSNSEVSSSWLGTTTEQVECNGDGLVCPDGSIVGRTGPMCQFTQCPGVMPVTGNQPHGMAILYGKVLLSPTCPVESVPPKKECSPQAYVTDVAAFDASTGRDIGIMTKTTANGTFIMDMAPGTYIVRAKGGDVYPKCTDVKVSLLANSSTTISISCDSGIR